MAIQIFDGLTKRRPPKLITIIGADETECRKRLDQIEATGELAGRKVRFITTAVKRADYPNGGALGFVTVESRSGAFS